MNRNGVPVLARSLTAAEDLQLWRSEKQSDNKFNQGRHVKCYSMTPLFTKGRFLAADTLVFKR